MSKEHAWPQWMKADADVLPTRTTTNIGFRRTSADAFSEDPNVFREQQGSVLTVGPREVCRVCNSGWMSQLESEARPTIEHVWTGQPTKLTSQESATIARWAIKTSWMHERARESDPTPDLSQRQAVMSGNHPELTRVWLGRYVGERDFGSPIVRTDLLHQDHPWDSTETARRMLAMLIFHGVALMVQTDTRFGIPPLRVEPATWLALAPRQTRGRLAYPPPSLTDEAIDQRLHVHRDWASLPEVPHFERDLSGWQSRPPRDRK